MAHKTIVLKGDPLQKEAVANAAITPGHLIEMMSTGKLRKHANADQNAAPIFAIEDSLQGKEIGDDYSANNRVQYVNARPGDEIYALLAAGESVNPSDYLVSNGDGTLKKHTAPTIESAEEETLYVNAIVAKPLETLDLSTSSATATRIKVEVV